MIFGEYLIQREIIQKPDLLRALEAQKKNRIPLGQLAIQQGLLDSKQLYRILSRKRKDGIAAKSFGRMAVEQGLLSEGQIDDLLKMQNQTNQLLGEALVSLGTLDKKSLIRALRDYRTYCRNEPPSTG